MKSSFLIFTILVFSLMSQQLDAQTPKEFAKAWDKYHITNKLPSNVRHKDLKVYLKQLKKLNIRVDEVGRSHQDREIYQIEWGKGKTKVFMWSQMHGDEPTATTALIDMFAFLETNRKGRKWVRMLEKSITIRAIPMLNPDGAELYRRRNLQGIDINRDAHSLKTPEAALLMKLRNEFQPEIGFNLHNQRELTTVGRTTNQASISLLAVRANPESEVSEGQFRNDRICALILGALNQFIEGNIGRYDDSYTASAFGDTFSDLGTPVILIETGGLHGKDGFYLAKMNFIAFLTALQSLVDGTSMKAGTVAYDNLPENGLGKLHNFVFRNASVVSLEQIHLGHEENEPATFVKDELIVRSVVTDIALNRYRRRAEIAAPPTYIKKVGGLATDRGLVEYDVSRFFVMPASGMLKPGRRGALVFYKKTRKLDWGAERFEEKFPPDAIFARGRWVKGAELFKK